MKKILLMFLAIFASLSFLACSKNTNVLTLPKYEINAKSSYSKNIALFVNDLRQNSEIASLTNAGGDISEKIKANESLADWLHHSLQARLADNSVGITGESLADFKVFVNIKKFQSAIDGIGTKNMRGNFELDIIIKKGNQTTTKTISQPQSDFAMMPSMSNLEPFTQSLLKDMLERTLSAILAGY